MTIERPSHSPRGRAGCRGMGRILPLKAVTRVRKCRTIRNGLIFVGALLLIALSGALVMGEALDAESAKAFVEQNRQSLDALAQLAQGKFLVFEELNWKDQMAFYRSGLHYIDGRLESGMAAFGFACALPEGDVTLYYSPLGAEAVLKSLGDDIGETDFAAPPEEIRVDGLGINGKGYVVYKALYPEWYFVERYLPT